MSLKETIETEYKSAFAVQVKGLDVVKVPAQAYPEGMNSPASEDV